MLVALLKGSKGDLANWNTVQARTITEIIDIVRALNYKVNQLEASQSRTANIASCLANGIQPD